MRRVICMTAYLRPEILVKTLASIRTAVEESEEEWRLVIGLEPASPTVWKIIQGIDWITLRVLHNPRILGPTFNPYNVVRTAIEEEGADLISYHQDDVLVSPDTLRLVSWVAGQPEFEQALSLNLLNFESEADRPWDVLWSWGDGAVGPRRIGCRFYPLGIAFTPKQFWDRLEGPWIRNDSENAGFDWALAGYMDGTLEPQTPMLVPAFSRNLHIGVEGTFSSSLVHEKFYANVPMLQTLPPQPGEYRIANEKTIR